MLSVVHYCLCRITFHYVMREWAECFIFDVRTDSCFMLNFELLHQNAGHFTVLIQFCHEQS